MPYVISSLPLLCAGVLTCCAWFIMPSAHVVCLAFMLVQRMCWWHVHPISRQRALQLWQAWMQARAKGCSLDDCVQYALLHVAGRNSNAVNGSIKGNKKRARRAQLLHQQSKTNCKQAGREGGEGGQPSGATAACATKDRHVAKACIARGEPKLVIPCACMSRLNASLQTQI